ncbi:MAG: dienelactone hydrolase family protein [Candidatus Thiodiazotropha sp. (ex Lucinoma borealis)]|nr:dienelactone hydrolase family protein [Candidatus Thiodiazotropha sp. (ex Lucinoma borealis)]
MTYSLLFCIATSILLTACTSPSLRFDQVAETYGFHRTEIPGKGFTHVIFNNDGQQASSTLHVYLGGDGTPWMGGFLIAQDPTPRNPVGLALMALDKAPSIYLGRPCYHGQSRQSPCIPALWTSARYSSQVVDSMALALRGVMDDFDYSTLKIFGFSGGGGLAMLLAQRFPETSTVVSLAGNLDIKAWASYHNYDPLHGSLNPESMQALPIGIRQYHLAGGKDKNIPPQIIREALKNQSNSQFILLEDFTHACCWEEVWREVLACVNADCEWLDASKQ